MMRVLVGLLAAAALALAPASIASERHPTQRELESELICPTCHTTLDQSNAPVARQMKSLIAQRIAAGDTKSEIEQRLVAEYGRGVLARPDTRGFDLLAWALPIVALLGGAAAVGVAAWRWSRRRGVPDQAATEPLDPDLERLVDDELRRLEA
jgi:cytochrome c-type biogenesis protein CcmH